MKRFDHYIGMDICDAQMDAFIKEVDEMGMTLNLTDLDDPMTNIDVDDQRLNVGHRHGKVVNIWVG